MDQARTGVTLVTASAVAYSTAGYFTRVIELDAWTMLLWRGLYAGLAILAFIGWQQRRHTVSSFSAISWAGIAVAFFSAFATIAYINALRLTSVAEALVISATAPFLTAGMAWVWHRDRTATSTLIASGIAFLGVVVTMNGATTQGHILGNLLALVVALCLSAMMVIIRRRREISMLPATCLSAFLCSILVLPVAMPSSAQGSTMILLMFFGVAQFGLGLILLTLGNRMISASRTALISCLDVPLGALWVWLAFNEVPPIAAFVGGMLIMAAVVGDTLAARAIWAPLCQHRQPVKDSSALTLGGWALRYTMRAGVASYRSVILSRKMRTSDRRHLLRKPKQVRHKERTPCDLIGRRPMSEFGGAWSTKKLDCVSSYLAAYQTALKKKNFDLVYIDAFCGDGSQKVRDGDEETLLGEAREFMRGSAQRAVELDIPFHRYHFIDKSKQSLSQLEERLTALKPDLVDRMRWHPGDVNVELPRIIRSLDIRRNRAVVFADPYGMQVDWETIEAVAACPIIDFWYLVPTGLAINRMATRNGKIPKSWSDRLDRFLGEKEWQQRWYRRTQEPDLFGGAVEIVEKVADINIIEDDFQARLGKAFPHVAKNRMQLKDQGRVLFTLMFACSNPRQQAYGLASKIANHLLKG